MPTPIQAIAGPPAPRPPSRPSRSKRATTSIQMHCPAIHSSVGHLLLGLASPWPLAPSSSRSSPTQWPSSTSSTVAPRPSPHRRQTDVRTLQQPQSYSAGPVPCSMPDLSQYLRCCCAGIDISKTPPMVTNYVILRFHRHAKVKKALHGLEQRNISSIGPMFKVN
ncbi:hypothetical protein BS78_04G031800 [Paspalum vaginatum]|nr:hypothetical protein BS78_04G031800 [Paspalum vaginatum]